MEDKKRKREEEEANTPKKERKLSSQDEEEEKPCGWHSLPVEIGAVILQHATQSKDVHENSSAWVVCRFVCRQWRDNLPHKPTRCWFLGGVLSKGYLGILKWAKENGCCWGQHTFAMAAKGGHVEMLKWMAENGCPKDHTMAKYDAVQTGQLAVLKWLKEDGCIFDPEDARRTAKGGHIEVLKWMKECSLWRFSRVVYCCGTGG